MEASILGPQYARDSPFTARMLLHQSWYRAAVLKRPFGTGPNASSVAYYGNMLDAEAAGAGANFLSPEIFEVARRRIASGPGVEPFRCLHNLLSGRRRLRHESALAEPPAGRGAPASPGHPYGRRGRYVVVGHPLDPEHGRAIGHYREMLVDPASTFAEWRLDAVVGAWSEVIRGAPERGWLAALRQRYLDLTGSAAAGS